MTMYRTILLLLILTVLGCTRVIDSVDPKSTNWTTHKSEHYTFHVRPNSPAATSIQQIRDEQEWAYRKINDRLGISFDQKLLVYIYNSRRDMGVTDRTGKAYPELKTIEAIYRPDLKSIGKRGVSMHELAHVVVYYGWCPSPEPLYGEGLAVWLDDYWKTSDIQSTDLYMISKKLLQKEKLPTVGEMMDHWSKIPTKVSYPAAGSFVKYLIKKHGVPAYKQLYCKAGKDNFADVFNDIYDKRIGVVESNYHDFLRNQ